MQSQPLLESLQFQTNQAPKRQLPTVPQQDPPTPTILQNIPSSSTEMQNGTNNESNLPFLPGSMGTIYATPNLLQSSKQLTASTTNILDRYNVAGDSRATVYEVGIVVPSVQISTANESTISKSNSLGIPQEQELKPSRSNRGGQMNTNNLSEPASRHRGSSQGAQTNPSRSESTSITQRRPSQPAPVNRNNVNEIQNISGPLEPNNIIVSSPSADMNRNLVARYLQNAPISWVTLMTSKLLSVISARDINRQCNDINPISVLSEKEQFKVACNRDFSPEKPHDNSLNQNMISSDGSVIRLFREDKPNPYIQAGAQVSLLFKSTSMMVNDAGTYRVVNPKALFVPRPKLIDSTECLETPIYLDKSKDVSVFNSKAFQTSHDMIQKHIFAGVDQLKAASQQEDDKFKFKRVVFVRKEDLGALSESDRNGSKATYHFTTAQNIDVKLTAETIFKLQQDSKIEKICFSDTSNKHGHVHQFYWEKVNITLRKLGAKSSVDPVSKTNAALGENWVQDTDLLIIDLDPQGMPYLENSTVGVAHMAMCERYNHQQSKTI